MTSCLEQLLALRPSDDIPNSIEVAIRALKEQRTAFATELAGLREKLKKEMLFERVAKVKAANEHALELERADAQAAELIAGFTTKLRQRREEVLESEVKERVTKLAAAMEAFNARFLEFYEPFAAEFPKFSAEYKALSDAHVAAVWEAQQFNRKFRTEASNLPKLPVPPVPFVALYFDKTVLPAMGLTPDDRYHTPLAHRGEFWKPSREEPTPQAFYDKIRRDTGERERKNKEHRERIARAHEANGRYQVQNLGPLTGH
jgi:hypothetical protein